MSNKKNISKLYKKLIQVQDPIYPLAQKISRGRPIIGAVLVGIIQLCLWWLVGSIIHTNFPNPEIVHLTDSDEFSFGFFLWGVFIPILWWYYLSWPSILKKVIKTLGDNDVISKDKLERAINSRQKNTFTIPACLITIFILILYFSDSITVEISSGRISFWFISWWSKLILGIFVGVSAYILIVFLFKVLQTILIFRKFFMKNGVKKVYVLHVDECGGFLVIGNLATRLSTLAVIVGMWAVWYSILPWLVGGKMNFSSTVLMLYGAYAILAPLLLLSLILPAHYAMQRYKKDRMHTYTQKIQNKFELVNTNFECEGLEITSPGKTRHYINECQKQYDFYMLLANTPEWPIKMLNLKRFTRFALLPGVGGVISFIITAYDILDLYTKIINNL